MLNNLFIVIYHIKDRYFPFKTTIYTIIYYICVANVNQNYYVLWKKVLLEYWYLGKQELEKQAFVTL